MRAVAQAYRGDGLDRPPLRLPLVSGRRLRKRWTYVGAFSPAVTACAAQVRVGPAAQEFWAVWDGTRLVERTRRRSGLVDVAPSRVRVAGVLALDVRPGGPVEVVTPYPPGWAWTRKQVGPATGVVLGAAFEGVALVDESAGYPPRRTSWRWTAGAGVTTTGQVVAWNATVGLHDTPGCAESTVWVDGVPRAVPVPAVAADLSAVTWEGAGLAFSAGAVRRRSESLVVVRSSYEQPFGTFTGTLPGGLELASGQGVMERHDAVW